MQNPLTPVLMMASLLLLCACQPPSSDQTDTPASVQVDEGSQSPTLLEAKTPKELTTSIVELSEGKLRDQLICTKLSDTMKAVNDSSSIKDIHGVQRQLKACLPTAINSETLQWLSEYQAMYDRFLGTDLYMDDANFYDVFETLERGKKASVAQLKQFNPRIRYLISLVESKADVSILYLGEGFYIFHHDLQAMADLFAPYLPRDQAEFIERMATDNQDIFWNDAAVAISVDQLIERATFWENYIQQYPDSYFIQDATRLFSLYRYVLFLGSDNTQWTNDDISEFVSPEYEQALHNLAKRSNSLLAQDARTLLDFMAMANSKRDQAYPVPKVDEEGYEISDWATPRYQLNKALSLPSPWKNNNNRDCLSGIICVNYNY
ncbi:hypothetical protein ACS8E3_01125 [Psychrobacter sp. 2Y5]|uniref:hypothetical protein n=1 Tax=unclassified Psychrobacter TaxID=196806 RepID=UPI003F45C491